MRSLTRLTDKLLSAFVAKSTAGACVPENGDTYWKSCGSCSCVPNQRWIRKDCQYRITCTGGSVATGATKCTTTQNIC